uniref:Uncharacterized protein n=1 Tax=Globisporangium ultimum (strain ATCC 200006 / CBS 805.95 / DAOM BR144) TaxID=431595 RepID=K3WRV8_GLOUD
MRGTNITPPSPSPPPTLPPAAPLHVPANAFVNDGNFMAQFLAANPPAPASSTEANGGDNSGKDVVVAAAEQDDRVRQSVANNDGSFMATFLALQHKEERRQQQQREKEQQVRADKDPVAAQKTMSGSSDTQSKQTQQQKTDVAANAVAIEQLSSKKKRNRWDAGPTTSPTRAAKSVKHTDGSEEASAAALLVDGSGLDDAREASIRAKQQKHLQELRFLEQRIRGFHQQSQLSKSGQSSKEHELAMLSDERRQEYERLAQLLEAEKAYKDSLEDAELGAIQDGTLEHRRRAREMLETLQTADALTTHAEGKHHLGDFLPQTELDKFMKEAQVLTSKNKLGLGNKAQLTDQQQAGSSSAAVSSGNRTAPAASASSSISTTSRGLGHESTGQLQEDDDEFDQYRKRMMLAYRFRPNPLVSLFRFVPNAMLTCLAN